MVALMRAAAIGLAKSHHQQGDLADVLAAKCEQALDELDGLVGLLPQKPGRKKLVDPEIGSLDLESLELEETPESFLQLVRVLKEERGWGRPAIAEFMRPFGVTETQVRNALDALPGEKRCSSTGAKTKVGGDRSRKRQVAQERDEGR
jgi:hypothetical protein